MTGMLRGVSVRDGLLLSTAIGLAVAGFPAGSPAQAQQAPAVSAAEESVFNADDIIVTATRQSQALSKVPVSVSAFTQSKMDQQGLKSIGDLTRLTPGLSFQDTGLRTNVSIRGISSTAGAATTGIYIDDTPIQVRVVGTSPQPAYPALFDLERVEVLRGPQGTLFGAGSEGGTIRFIQPQPSLDRYTTYARAEGAMTRGGAGSYELGLAVGGPLIQDVLGFRASIYYRHDGGWISREEGTMSVVTANGSAGPQDSLHFTPSRMAEEHSNWKNTTVGRLAITWKPTDSISITPSITGQKIFINDNIFAFWPAMSDYSRDRYAIQAFSPTVDANHVPMPETPSNGREPVRDWFWLPNLKVEAGLGELPILGEIDFISSTSYYSRKRDTTPDYTALYARLYARRQVALPGDKVISPAMNRSKNFTQEARLQTSDPDAPVNLVLGVYYSHDRQTAIQDSMPNFINQVSSIANTALPGYPVPPAAVNDGAPFGPGYSAYINYYGMDLWKGTTSYHHNIVSDEKQTAFFGQADLNVTSKLKLTAGVRYSHDSITLVPDYNGPNSNLNAPHGLACVPGTGLPGTPDCIAVPVGAYAPDTGPFKVAFETTPQSNSGNAVTPKFGVSYQADDRNLFYATVAKGFRPGGAQQRQPSTCDLQLGALGYVDEAGFPHSPTTYNSDSLWSYEVGSKNRLFGGRVSIDASAYLIKWKDIQTSVSLTSCVQSFFDNLGDVTGRGFDLQTSFNLLPGLNLGVTASYNKTTFDQASIMGGRQLFSKGSAVPQGPSPWVVVVSGQYDFDFANRDSYARFDYTYNSELPRTGATDPKSVSYDPLVPPTPGTHLVNARIGMLVEGADVSVFMNNVLNAHPQLMLGRTNGQALYTDMTFRPRTTGVTVTYRY